MSLRNLASPTNRRRGVAALAAGGAVVAAMLGATPAHAVAPISSAITNDPNADKGTLTFFDGSGNVVTAGSNLHQLFNYAEASSAGRSGATKATVSFAFPDHTKSDSQQWTTDQVTASTLYPNTSAPAPLNTAVNPVAEADSGDADLASLLPTTTQDQTDGYKQYLQVRLYDSGPGVPTTTDFWATDIMYDGVAGTWQQVFPSTVQSAPGAPTNVSASAGHGAAQVSWTAPANTGSAALTGYDVQYSADSGAHWTSASSAFHSSTATTQTVTGLTPGTSYVFQVAAINPVGTGPYSAASSPGVTPLADNSALSIGKSTTVDYGKATTISSTLTDKSAGHPAAGQTVSLYHRSSTTTAWIKGPSTTTGSTGRAAFSVKPTARTLYQVRFAGSTALLPAVSPTETVSVGQLVSINLTPATVRHGKSFAVWGAVTPSTAGRRVTLQRRSGTRFSTVGTTNTKRQSLPNGRTAVGYVFHVTQAKAGSYVFRVTAASTSSLLGATSHTATEHVT